jgi:signal transduction histidine kinase/AmiR/NasT family two-component response regulator
MAAEGAGTSYQLTLAALTLPGVRQAGFNIALGLAFWLLAGPWLALGWTLSLCITDLVLQQVFRRLRRQAATVPSKRGETWLSGIVLFKSLVWYWAPVAFTLITHNRDGLAFLFVQAIGLTSLSVSTARNSRRVFLGMMVVPVLSVTVCIAQILGLRHGAAALCETAILAFALWQIASGTSRVVADWNRSNDERIKALGEMREALARSEVAETRLSEALSRAEAGSRAKSAFLATMSHEIRTPLNGVLGMAQAMRRDRLSKAQRERLDLVVDSGEALLVLLNNLLDLSKIDAGKLELEAGVIDVDDLAAAVQAFGALLQDKDVSLSVTVAPDARGCWAGDPARVRQVLHNLISNAVKFTERGAISVAISHHGQGLAFSVKDTGIGIAKARLAQVFEPFIQGDTSTTRRFGGTGLGLAICRDLVALMDGEIMLDSVEGRGTTFTVRLPLIRVEPPATEETALAQPEALSGKGLRILAAEDNPMNQAVLRALMEAIGADLVMVSDGREALDAWRSGHWDAVLMDVQMPVMDGVAATKAIRRAEKTARLPRTPIIALTANTMDHHRQEYLAAGMDALAPKPIDLAFLVQTLHAVLAESVEETLAAQA